MNDNGIKNGKKPLSQKPVNDSDLFSDALFGDTLGIDSKIKAEAASKGLELRFVSAKGLYENNGYHKNGWYAYVQDKGSSATIDSSTKFKYGNDPDGVLRRGDSILACRSIDLGERHRQKLAEKATRYSQRSHKKNLDDIKESMRAGGVGGSVKVFVGDDE